MKVRLISYTPEPLKTLTKATLVSYWDEWSIDNLDNITEKDAEMHIPKVLSYGHESILEHINLTFAVEGVSIVTLKQITRHRHMSFTVRSQRYVTEDGVDFIIPDSLRNVRIDMKIPYIEDGEYKTADYSIDVGAKVIDVLQKSREVYRELIETGVPQEDARFILPQAVETKFVVTMNMREFKHFLGLRMCERAQWEIRELAWKMWEEAMKVPDLKKIMIWGKFGPKCISLGYCPEGELMPEGCLMRQKEWWRKIKEGIKNNIGEGEMENEGGE